MGNETEQIEQSDETIIKEFDQCKLEGRTPTKQTIDGVGGNRDEKFGGTRPTPSPSVDFMGWSNNATPIPTTLLGNGGGIDSGGSLRPPCIPPYLYPGAQNLNPFNILPMLQYSSLPTDSQQNSNPQCSGFVAFSFIPIIGIAGNMSSSSNMFTMPMMMPMNIGQPMTMDGNHNQSAVFGRLITETLERVPQVETGNIDGVQRPAWGGAPGAERPNIEPQRQVNYRFRVGFQLDLLLILKLAVVVFVFNQDGSKDRLFLLLFLAVIVYMYQTGALAPLLCWFSQTAQRAMMPPQQHEHANIVGQGQPLGGAAMGGAIGGGFEQNEVRNHAHQGLNNNMQRPPPPDGGNWWGLFKEMQMLIVGFVTSLLPGYQHVE